MKTLIIALSLLLLATPAMAQISEKTGAAAAEIAEGEKTHKSKTVTTTTRLRSTTPEQRKAEDDQSQQDSTQRPPSRMETLMKQGTDRSPYTFPVK
jgi:hypothetical protein